MIAMLIYAFVFSYFTILKHYQFASYSDLGSFNQAFYTTIFHGKLFYYTTELYFSPSGSYFAVHFSPILFPLLPFYMLKPSAITLLVIKSFILAFGALPLYLLSIEVLKNKKIGMALCIAYLLNPALHGANWFDFQPQIFIPILLFSLFLFLLKKRWKLYFASTILALSVEEHLVFIIILISVYTLFTSDMKLIRRSLNPMKGFNNSSVSIITILICIIWYFLIIYVKNFYFLNPEFLDIYRAVHNYDVLGFKGDILRLPIYVLLHLPLTFKALLYDFHLKFLYIVILFSPVLFIPFRSQITFITLVILVPMLLTNYRAYYMIGSHYPLYLLPFLFIATIDGLSNWSSNMNFDILQLPILKKVRYENLKATLLNLLLVTIIFTSSISPISPIAYTFSKGNQLLWYPNPQPYPDNFVKVLHEIIGKLPPEASILTQNHLFSHISNRINAYCLPVFFTQEKQSSLENYVRQFINKSDYILLDVRVPDFWTRFVFNEVINSENFGAYAFAGQFVLFKKEYTDKPSFIPYLSYEIFPAYKNLLIEHGEIIQDTTSKNGYVALSSTNKQEIFVFGPYIYLPPGIFEITFTIKLGEQDDGCIATLDVCDDGGNTPLAKRSLYGFELRSNEWTNVTLTFSSIKQRSSVEFRIFTEGVVNIYLDEVIVKITSPVATTEFGTTTFNYENLKLYSGNITNEKLLVHRGNIKADAFFWYGPYTTLPSGNYSASFFLKVSPAPQNMTERILTLDIAKDLGWNVTAYDEVDGKKLLCSRINSKWYKVTLEFETKSTLKNIEFRGLIPSPKYDIYLAYILVERIETS